MNSRTLHFAATVSLIVAFSATASAKRPGAGDTTVSHRAKQDNPIQLGTSGGWAYDLANGYCCGGTLGSLVQLGDGSLHILSNFHVLASDVVPGGNGIVADTDLPFGRVIQPGLIDVGCNASSAQDVALLSEVADPLDPDGHPIVDAALAQIIDGMVSADGAILEIGVIANVTMPVEGVVPGLAVKKSGRTTGFTRSTVEYINASVTITYEDECAGSVRGSARFEDQIVAANRGNSFLDSGDSGSLMVEDIGSTPRAVGLLFAGSSTYAIANPIDDVLARFGAKMVGADYVPGGNTGGSGSGSGGHGRGKPKNGQTGLDRAASVQKHNLKVLDAIKLSNGHGLGIDEAGRAFIAVMVESLSAIPGNVPSSIDGVPVRIVEVGRLVAY